MNGTSIILLDGPPASGKTTICKILSKRYCCPCVRYKCLGFANVIAKIILKLTTRDSNLLTCLVSRKEDPILLLGTSFLRKNRHVIFLLEIPYKVLQVILICLLVKVRNCIIIDEFLSLRVANYINMYIHGGLSRCHMEILIRLDLASLITFALSKSAFYIYVDRRLEELERMWSQREHNKEYSRLFLALVRATWKKYKPLICRFVQIVEILPSSQMNL